MSYSTVKIEPLNKENFDTWKIQVQALLIKSESWKYVCGKCVKPADATQANLWLENDEKAKSDLILAISPPELRQINNCNTSKEVWDKLHSVYQSRGPARQAMLLKSLILTKMQSGDDMRDHVRKFFEVVDKLNEMQLIIIDELLAILLLYSIPNEYETFRIAIESQEKLPKIEILKVKLLEEFEARKRNTNDHIEGAMYSKNKTNNSNNNYPDRNNRNNSEKSKFKYACHTCGKIGHMARDCRSKSFNKKKQNNKTEASCNVNEVANNIQEYYGKWCLDSGASSHMCPAEEKFGNIENKKNGQLALANNNTTEIRGIGNIQFESSDCKIKLKETLFVPDLRTNLLSVSKITQSGLEVIFKRNEAIVRDPHKNKKLFVAKREKGLYYVSENLEVASISQTKEKSLQDWHEIFGHINEKDLKEMIKKEKVIGIRTNIETNLPACDVCIQGKQSQTPFSSSHSKSGELLALVHSDVCGPMRVRSFGGTRYFVTFIDDKSRWCEIYFMENKSEVAKKFIEFKNMAERKTGMKIKCLRSDNGTEYVNNYMNDFLKNHGIRHELTIEYTPQQNGVSERKNRTLLDMARCMLIQSGLPPTFWAEAVNTANYVRNRCPSQSIDGEIPYKIWMNKTPDVKFFQKFGCSAFMLDKTPGKGKFESRSIKCIFIGYSEISKAYRLWDPEARKVRRSRDVVFTPSTNTNEFEEFISEDIEHRFSENPDVPSNTPTQQLTNDEDTATVSGNKVQTRNETDKKRSRGRPKKIVTGKRGRPKKNQNTIASDEDSMDDLDDFLGFDNSEDEEYQSANLIQPTDPKTSIEALTGPEAEEWRNAMLKEYETLLKNQTWKTVNRPTGRKVVESKWALRTKYKIDGSIDCRKARLVAKGFTQHPGIDYNETFSPVARMSSIRFLIAIAAKFGLEVHQLDFVGAYLNGVIEEEIYMEMPNDLHKVLHKREASKYKNKVCLLKKAIYGLKQSGRLWYEKLDTKLREMNLAPSKCDPCIYINKNDNNMTLIAIYVDDLIVASSDQNVLTNLKNELANTFEMKDLGPIQFCLGIEFNQDVKSGKICMSQSKYIQHLLERFGMADCKPVSTPTNISEKLSKEMSPKDENEKREAEKLPYQGLVGSLMYLAVSTRPDIAHVVSVLSQFNVDYGTAHWVAAKRVLRYLKGTKNIGLVYSSNNKPVEGYADADWGSNIDDRKSYTGYAFTYANGAISWESRKQKTVAVSSTEAEYMALSDSTKEAIYLKRFSNEILGNNNPVCIYNDNQSAEKLCRNPIFHNRTKHVDIRHHFIRDSIERGEVEVKYMRTDDMPADFLTKGLAAPKHNKCAESLGLKLLNL